MTEGSPLEFETVWASSTHGLSGTAATGALAAELLHSPDGKFLILSSRFDAQPSGDDTLVSFAVNADGTLGPALVAGAGGRNPRGLSLNHDGSLLAVALQADAKVVVFERNVDSGVLGKAVGSVVTEAQPVAVIWG